MNIFLMVYLTGAVVVFILGQIFLGFNIALEEDGDVASAFIGVIVAALLWPIFVIPVVTAFFVSMFRRIKNYKNEH